MERFYNSFLYAFSIVSFLTLIASEAQNKASTSEPIPSCSINIGYSVDHSVQDSADPLSSNRSRSKVKENITCRRAGLVGFLVATFDLDNCSVEVFHSDGICQLNNCNIPVFSGVSMKYFVMQTMNETCHMPNTHTYVDAPYCQWLRPDCVHPLKPCSRPANLLINSAQIEMRQLYTEEGHNAPASSSPTSLPTSGDQVHGASSPTPSSPAPAAQAPPSLASFAAKSNREQVLRLCLIHGEETLYHCNIFMPDVWYTIVDNNGVYVKKLVMLHECSTKICSSPPHEPFTRMTWQPPYAYYTCDYDTSSTRSFQNFTRKCINGRWTKALPKPIDCRAQREGISLHINSDIILFISICGCVILLIITLLLAGYVKRWQSRRISRGRSATEHISRSSTHSSSSSGSSSSSTSRVHQRSSRSRSSRRRRHRLLRSSGSSMPPDYTSLPDHQFADQLGRMTAMPSTSDQSSCTNPPSYVDCNKPDDYNPPAYIATISSTIPDPIPAQVHVSSRSIGDLAHEQDICTSYSLQLLQ